MPADLGWLIVGHGTRHVPGLREFSQIAQLLQAQANVPVEACFLELAEPTIEQGLTALAQRGVKRVLVVPLLLFAAGHAKQDVPRAVAECAQSLGLEIMAQIAALEDHAALLELSCLRVREALPTADLEHARVLLVGRGSGDRAAIEKVRTYARTIANLLQLPCEVAFVAVAQPRLLEKLAELGRQQVPAVIVLPHLLFRGEVLQTIQAEIAAAKAESLQTNWIMAEHLGAHRLVAEAILARIESAMQGKMV